MFMLSIPLALLSVQGAQAIRYAVYNNSLLQSKYGTSTLFLYKGCLTLGDLRSDYPIQVSQDENSSSDDVQYIQSCPLVGTKYIRVFFGSGWVG